MISICMYAITLNSEVRGGDRRGLVAACFALRSHVQRLSIGSNASSPRFWVVERVAVLGPSQVKAIDQRVCGIRYEKLQRKTMAPEQAALRIRLLRAMRSNSRRNIRRVIDSTLGLFSGHLGLIGLRPLPPASLSKRVETIAVVRSGSSEL